MDIDLTIILKLMLKKLDMRLALSHLAHDGVQ
jgi:hypothetical protein